MLKFKGRGTTHQDHGHVNQMIVLITSSEKGCRTQLQKRGGEIDEGKLSEKGR